MQEITGNIWEKYEKGLHYNDGTYIVIPTNGFVRKNGTCVMGRGLALQAAKKFPELGKQLGDRIKEYGNVIFTFCNINIITFPVKHNWWENADLKLIEQSAKDLATIYKYNLSGLPTPVYLPRVGCGNGKLNWKDVKPILEKYLDDRFIICDNGSGNKNATY